MEFRRIVELLSLAVFGALLASLAFVRHPNLSTAMQCALLIPGVLAFGFLGRSFYKRWKETGDAANHSPHRAILESVRSLARTQFSIDRSSDAVLWMARDGRLTYVNAR